MIVSASYIDDIPAYYGRWFMKRLDAGYCRVFDANGLRLHRVALTREAVDAFVFWTRNAAPFLQALEEIDRRGYAFVVQYAVTGDNAEATREIRELAREYGPHRIVWRYEPICSRSGTPEWHALRFETLARELQGATEEAVVAFSEADPVGDPRELVKRMARSAQGCGMRLAICSQPEYLVPGANPARCIDAGRISRVIGRTLERETRPRCPGCLCAAAYDIGGALESGLPVGAAMAPRRANHDVDGEFLVPPPQPFSRLDGASLPF